MYLEILSMETYYELDFYHRLLKSIELINNQNYNSVWVSLRREVVEEREKKGRGQMEEEMKKRWDEGENGRRGLRKGRK